MTKPGANKLHGNGYYNFGDRVWNSRNPYAAEKAPFLLKEYGGSLGGPFHKSASFFLTADRAAIDNGAIVNGTTLNPNTLAIINPYPQVFRIPQRRIRVSSRIDYQLRPNDTLSVRYQISGADIQHSGVGGSNLVSTGTHNHGTDQVNLSWSYDSKALACGTENGLVLIAADTGEAKQLTSAPKGRFRSL